MTERIVDQEADGERFICPSEIRDPLEGIIPGENKVERYAYFSHRVLGRIWPNGSSSREYGDDYWRTYRFNEGELSGYTHFSPSAVDPARLRPDEFEVVVANMGTIDYPRVRAIPPQLLQEGASVIPVGGSCPVETWGMRIIAEIRAGMAQEVVDDSLLPDTVRQILDFAPTMSHISGGILSGQDSLVHLVESDMWSERIAEYGIEKPEADELINQAYSRICDAIARRARLINPDAEVIHVNFDDLDLVGSLTDWFQTMDIPYDPSHRVWEVIETYIAPAQRDLLRKALTTRLDTDTTLSEGERAAIQSLLAAKYHMRGKQIDHGRWGSMNLPKEVIVGQRELNEDEIAAHGSEGNIDYAWMTGLRVMRDVYLRHTQGNPTSIVTLFADIPGYKSTVQHQDREMGQRFNGRPGDEKFLASLNACLENPRRLHRGNVEDHIAFLSLFTEDNEQQRRDLIRQKVALIKQLKPYTDKAKKLNRARSKFEGRMTTYERRIGENENVLVFGNFVQAIGRSESQVEINQTIMETAVTLNERLSGALASIRSKETHIDEDEADMAELPQVILFLEQIEAGEIPEASEVVRRRVNHLFEESEKSVAAFKASLLEVEAQRTEIVAELHTTEQDSAPMREEVVNFEEQIRALTISYLPLAENPFVHHAMQFLWEPDFVAFLTHAVAIQEDLQERGRKYRGEANQRMRELSKAIYPKLTAYIKYLFGQIEYPHEVRESRFIT